MDTFLWRRLDAPGHDACRLVQVADGRLLKGMAVYRHEGSPAFLAYTLDFDNEWRTREGVVRGWVGAKQIDFHVVRTSDGVWTLNGLAAAGLDECVDLDLGFTPATNLSQLRRVALDVGQAVDVPVAWLDVSAGTLDILRQRYERLGATIYRYEAPRFDYYAELQVNAGGFVEQYPGLWEMAS
ncbi:MAG TPA: putative glycolipid-binding domain-containing protein [Gammaproteobacteria bacterium]|jgi:hypothetical protein